MSHVRCRQCGARRTLRMHPDSYMPGRIPRCRGGGCRSKDYRVDHYRMQHEVGPGRPDPCRCGEYMGRDGVMPHARGRGWCMHNDSKTDAERQERWEQGYRGPRR